MSNHKILIPIVFLSLSFCGILGFQLIETINQKDSYIQARQQQEKPLSEIKKVQTQVDAIAVGTLKLAQQGNPNAKLVIDKLNKMGISISDPNAPTPTKP